MVIREKLMTKKKDGEELRTDSRSTQNALFLQKNEESVTWNETHRKEDEVCAKAAAEKLRGNLRDDSGETCLEHVRLEANPKKQYTLT